MPVAFSAANTDKRIRVLVVGLEAPSTTGPDFSPNDSPTSCQWKTERHVPRHLLVPISSQCTTPPLPLCLDTARNRHGVIRHRPCAARHLARHMPVPTALRLLRVLRPEDHVHLGRRRGCLEAFVRRRVCHPRCRLLREPGGRAVVEARGQVSRVLSSFKSKSNDVFIYYRLLSNLHRREKVMSSFAILWAFIGGGIFLSYFDTTAVYAGISSRP